MTQQDSRDEGSPLKAALEEALALAGLLRRQLQQERQLAAQRRAAAAVDAGTQTEPHGPEAEGGRCAGLRLSTPVAEQARDAIRSHCLDTPLGSTLSCMATPLSTAPGRGWRSPSASPAPRRLAPAMSLARAGALPCTPGTSAPGQGQGQRQGPQQGQGPAPGAPPPSAAGRQQEGALRGVEGAEGAQGAGGVDGAAAARPACGAAPSPPRVAVFTPHIATARLSAAARWMRQQLQELPQQTGRPRRHSDSSLGPAAEGLAGAEPEGAGAAAAGGTARAGTGAAQAHVPQQGPGAEAPGPRAAAAGTAGAERGAGAMPAGAPEGAAAAAAPSSGPRALRDVTAASANAPGAGGAQVGGKGPAHARHLPAGEGGGRCL